MKKKITLLLIILPIIIFADTYTLDFLISQGIMHSFDMQSEELNLQSAETDMLTTYMTLLPSANISANKNYSNKEWQLISSGFSIGESVSWNDYRYFSIKQKLRDKKNAKLSYSEKKKRFVFNVFSKYVNVLKAQKNLNILKENYKLQEKTKNSMKIKYESGNASLLDFKQTEISLLSDRIKINDAENDLDNMRYELFSFINIKDEKKELEDISINIKDVNIDSIVFAENNSIKISKNNFKNKEISLLQQRLNLYPSLSLSMSYNYSSTYPYDFLNFNKYKSSYSMGISFSYSIFDIPSKKLNYAQSKRMLHFQDLQLNKDISDQKQKFEQLKKDLLSLKKSYLLEKQKLTLAENNFELAQDQFNLGYISLLDFDKNKISLMNSKISFNNTYYDIISKIENLKLQISSKVLNKW